MKTSEQTTTKGTTTMSTKTITRNNSDEMTMLALDLWTAGFRAQVQTEYGVIRVSLNRRDIYAYEVERALDAAGYEPCQYSLNAACGVVFVRAIVL